MEIESEKEGTLESSLFTSRFPSNCQVPICGQPAYNKDLDGRIWCEEHKNRGRFPQFKNANQATPAVEAPVSAPAAAPVKAPVKKMEASKPEAKEKPKSAPAKANKPVAKKVAPAKKTVSKIVSKSSKKPTKSAHKK